MNNGFVDSILACFSNHNDQFNFLAVDKAWNQVHFNHLTLEYDRKKFHEAYRVYKKLKKLGGRRDQPESENNPAMVDNEENDSDDNQIKVEPHDMAEIHNKMNDLLD